jgi:hypothetical protein
LVGVVGVIKDWILILNLLAALHAGEEPLATVVGGWTALGEKKSF